MINFLILLVVLGVAVWLIENYVPMSEPFKVIFRVVVVLFLLIYLLNILGIVSIPIR